jgi:[ribosomal protein S5]-alanine N-acetyltransferase
MRIELITPRPDHYPVIYSWRSEASTIRHNPLAATSFDDFANGFMRVGSDLRDLSRFERYAWACLANGELVGNINLKNISLMMQHGELGYTVGEKFQGRGIGTLMVKEMCLKIFRETEMRKLFAYVHDANFGSCRVLEKVGFRREGLLREHYMINGKPENEVFYGLLRSDWT